MTNLGLLERLEPTPESRRFWLAAVEHCSSSVLSKLDWLCNYNFRYFSIRFSTHFSSYSIHMKLGNDSIGSRGTGTTEL